jgi:hypothetical protein
MIVALTRRECLICTQLHNKVANGVAALQQRIVILTRAPERNTYPFAPVTTVSASGEEVRAAASTD